MSLVEGLSKKYGDFHLDVPRLEVADHGVTAIWGPSGSGKSSLLRVLMGFEVCPGLRWQFGDLDLAQLSVAERRIGVVFQSYELFPHLSVRENLLFGAKARKLSPSWYEPQLLRLEQRLGISPIMNKNAGRLSGGEKQRVALGRALLCQPRVLFLDEPFSALDEDNQDQARGLLRVCLQEQGVPALLVTHDSRDVRALAHTQIEMREGKVIGTTAIHS